ncbi:DUF2721 domain-containing protein [Planctomicrobium sp. SH664]|uniref:DUF2721 domain-containing protein n=1 Tax=Planctomicrobium sp. SH664 TaxID=3448125 RepID=UPI003F5C84EF
MAMNPTPFAALSLIVAPAILTNASSVMIMSTSNRLARAVDRARELSKQLEATTDLASPEAERRLRELNAAETRTLLLLTSLRSFYVALGGFAAASLISLLGIIFEPLEAAVTVRLLEVGGVGAGVVAVGAIMYGSIILLRETRIAVRVTTERAATVRARALQ